MNESDNSIRIMEELMREMRRLAAHKEVSVSDIIHEALGEFLFSREESINYFDIIHSIEESMNKAEHFAVNANPYDSVVSVKSPLQYTYRPALRYEIKITKNSVPQIGTMSVALRSDDINTLRSFSDFLGLWMKLENEYMSRKLREPIEYLTDIGYFGRKIYLPMAAQHISGQAIGAAIGDYIHTFDNLFKYYFYHPNSGDHIIDVMYISHVEDGKLSI